MTRRPIRSALAGAAFALASLSATVAGAADVPVAGQRITLRDRAERPAARRASIVLSDAAIGSPLSDPRGAATTLVVSGGAAGGQCFARIALDPLLWKRIPGKLDRYVYTDRKGSRGGVRRVTFQSGRIAIRASGDAWPCAVLAEAQRLALTTSLQVDSTRYCASFGGDVRRNTAGIFIARGEAAPPGCPKSDVTVANLNVLHGLFCPGPSANCRRTDRLDLLFQWIAARGCPDLVTLQEIWDPAVPEIQARLAVACPFAYEMGYQRTNGVDDAIVLSRFPLVETAVTLLYKNFRHALRARVDHPLGPLDAFTPHPASGSDGANQPCAAGCPVECVTGGAATVRQCQALQLAAVARGGGPSPLPVILTGDMNASPTSFEIQQLVAAGFVDSHLAAGNPECAPATGANCTAGREDQDLSELESPASNQTQRIDYGFVLPPQIGACSFDGPADGDGDGTATGVFDPVPNPFVPACGPLPDPICWPSDHDGTELDLNCG